MYFSISVLSAVFSVAVHREGAPVGDHHAAPDGGRDGAAPPAARRLPAQLLAAAPATEHRQGSHNLLRLLLKADMPADCPLIIFFAKLFTLTLTLTCQLIVP